MNKSIWWALTIKNSICTICWVTLAIVFHKWWIALFSILFWSYLKTGPAYYRICDTCGKQSEYAESYNEALYKARRAGWIHYAEENKDYCPECKNLAIFNHELKLVNTVDE